MATLATIRDHLEYILNIPSGDAFIDSSNQLDLINIAYRKNDIWLGFDKISSGGSNSFSL